MTALLRPPEWTRDAACVNHPLGHTAFDQGTPEARAVCATCPVRFTCALRGLAEAEPEGMWGGLDPKDRRRIAKDRGFRRPGAAQHGTRACYVAGCRRPECREAHRRYIESRSHGKGHRRPADTTDRKISA